MMFLILADAGKSAPRTIGRGVSGVNIRHLKMIWSRYRSRIQDNSNNSVVIPHDKWPGLTETYAAPFSHPCKIRQPATASN